MNVEEKKGRLFFIKHKGQIEHIVFFSSCKELKILCDLSDLCV